MSKAKDIAPAAKKEVTSDKKAVKKASKPDKAKKPNVFKRMFRYFKDLKNEFKKVVWPTKKQVLNNTGVVLIFSGVTAVIVWVLDLIFITVFNLLY